MTDSISLERRGRVAFIAIERPPLNILDLTSITSLRRCLAELMVDRDLQLVVLSGSGNKAFSAGVAVEDHTPDKVPAMLREFHGAISILREMPAVSLAAVRGHCLGGGMELAGGCDLIVASEDSRFGQPEIKLGCFPPLAAALYPSLLGAKKTFELLLTGRTFSCAEAQDMGFVNRCVGAEGFQTTIEEVIQSITSHSLAVTRLTKKAILAGQTSAYSEALEQAEQIYLEELIATEDMHEGLAAFMEKRQPDWKHR